MYWIEELKNQMGDEVRLVSQKGHEHWGFEVGKTYRIVKKGSRTRPYGFEGVKGYGQESCNPGSNYGWVFEPAGPLVVENE